MEIPKIVHGSWHPILKPAFEGFQMERTFKALQTETSYFPEENDIFKVFRMPIDDIRVMILGQDPYVKKGQATGLAFQVPKGTKRPYSLRKIDEELGHTADLDKWEQQGVFLLNTALTVREKEPGSHKNFRYDRYTILDLWSWFTKGVIRRIAWNTSNVVWMLWGTEAQGYAGRIGPDRGHTILQAAHPASERHRFGGFLGCNHFRECNLILRSRGQETIDW